MLFLLNFFHLFYIIKLEDRGQRVSQSRKEGARTSHIFGAHIFMKKRILYLLCGFLFFFTVLLCSDQTAEAASNKYYIKVNKGTNVVTVYNTKTNKPVKAMICSAGQPTRTGTFYTQAKYRWKYLIGPSYGQYSTRIYGGVLFHSVFYWTNGDKSSMSTSAYNLLGTLQSHGCIRLLVKDAKWIYDNCPLRTKVIIFNGTSKDDPLGRPVFGKLLNGKYTNWDPTDPDPKNPWRNKKPTITVNTSKLTLKYGAKFNAFSAVTAKDSLGNNANNQTKVSGTVNTKKAGTYTVTYKCTDFLGHSVTKKVKYKVIDTGIPTISGVKKRSGYAGYSVNLKTGVTAKSSRGKNLTSKVAIYVKDPYDKITPNKYRYQKSGTYTFSKAGTYNICYKLTDSGKVKKVVTTVKITDRRVKLTLKTTGKTIEYGTKYSFSLNDVVKSLKTYNGKNLALTSKNISYFANFTTQKVGTYTIKITAKQSGQNYSTRTATFTLKVVNQKAPVISGVPDSELTLDPLDPPADRTLSLLKGVSARTATGIDLTRHLRVFVYKDGRPQTLQGNTFTFTEPGIYTVSYSVSIPNGSKSVSVSRKVTVKEPPAEEPADEPQPVSL